MFFKNYRLIIDCFFDYRPAVNEKTAQINKIIHGDHRLSIRMIAETVNVDKETV